MRYLFAILGAVLGTGLVAFYVGVPVADWAVAKQSFGNPIEADDMHMWVYLGSMLCGLIAGWALGWGLGARFEGSEPDV